MSGFILMDIKTAGTLKYLKENWRIVFQGDIFHWDLVPCQLVQRKCKRLLRSEDGSNRQLMKAGISRFSHSTFAFMTLMIDLGKKKDVIWRNNWSGAAVCNKACSDNPSIMIIL